MKKMYTFLLAAVSMVVGNALYGQSCDTLRNYDVVDANTNGFSWWNPAVGGWGAIPGHADLDGTGRTYIEYAEEFNYVGSAEVRGVRMPFIKAYDGSGTGTIEIRIYANNTVTPGTPGVILDTEVINISDINQTPGFATWNQFDLTTPTTVSGTFFVGYQLNYGSPQDTILVGECATSGTGNDSFFANETGTGWLNTSIYGVTNSSIGMDVLLSNAPDPVAAFTMPSFEACVSGVFSPDASTSQNADTYQWFLEDLPYTTTFDNQTGVTPTINPTQPTNVVNPGPPVETDQALFLVVNGGCRSDAIGYYVEIHPDVNATVTPNTATCGNNNGSIAVTNETGGDGTYTYTINGGAPQAGASFLNLAPGSYDIAVLSPGNGCEYTETVTVGNIPAEIVTAGGNQTVCENDAITLTSSGNGVSFEWTDGGGNIVGTNQNQAITATSTQTYTVEMTDANGCTDTDQLIVTVDPAPTVSTSGDVAICLGASTSISASGASSYTWDNSLGAGAVHSVSPTTTTIYNVTGTGSNNCTATEQLTVTVNPVDDPSFSFNNFCVGANNGPTGIATNGGTFAFNPAPGDGATINSSTGEISGGLLGTTYNVEYTTNGVCPASNVEQVTVQANDDATFTFADICNGDNAVPSNIATANGTFSFTSVPGDGATINGTTGEISGYTLGTTYDVTYTTPAGVCQATSNETVTVNALPNINAGTDETICEGDQVTIEATGGLTYNWDNGLGAGATQQVSPANTTTYTVTGTDANGCQNTDAVQVSVNPAIAVTETVTPSSGSNGSIQLSVSGGDGTYTFSWDNGESTQDISGLAPGNYTVTITDGNGCTFQETYTVESTVGVEENNFKALSMYPNPSHSSVTIVLDNHSFDFVVMNTLGQIITQGNAQNDVQVNTSDFEAGVYFVKVNTEGFEKTLRLVVKH